MKSGRKTPGGRAPKTLGTPWAGFRSSRKVFIDTSFYGDCVCSEIERLFRASTLNPITLCIDSSGGYLKELIKVEKLIENTLAPIDGLVVGQARSAAFYLLQACRKRLAYPEAQFMFHAPRILYPKTSTLIFRKKFYEVKAHRVLGNSELYLNFLESLAKRSGQPIELLRKWGSEEKIFTVEEAKELGFIDDIVH